MVSWYYNRKITHNQEKLFTIISEKKKILDEVTETETYKKAKEILLKFAPDELNMTPVSTFTCYCYNRDCTLSATSPFFSFYVNLPSFPLKPTLFPYFPYNLHDQYTKFVFKSV